MTLENTFYTLAIIYMVFGIIISIVLVFAVFYIKKRIETISDNIEEQIERFRESPGDVAMDIGSAIAASAISQVKKMLAR
ncbi:MAG TPA: hypothetical protein PLD54_00590 [Candidatus Levybacteria bacterium]|nr:hypothetical protein [Candidatus Levybacteria bacterium]